MWLHGCWVGMLHVDVVMYICRWVCTYSEYAEVVALLQKVGARSIMALITNLIEPVLS